jgi:hypothetical protein
MYRTVVTICTASLTFSNSTFCPHSVFMCFVWIWEQTAIISLYSINWLVCITETECVYCAVRTGSLYIIQVMCFVWIWEHTAIISLYHMNWLVCITDGECLLRGTDWIVECRFSHRPVSAEARSLPCQSVCCGGQSSTGTGFSHSTSESPCQYRPTKCSTFIFIYTLLSPEGEMDEAWEPSERNAVAPVWQLPPSLHVQVQYINCF